MRVFAVVGLPGTGKSTLVRRLAEVANYPTAEERPEERPFQSLCKQAPRQFSFLNQMDFLLHKAALEQHLSKAQDPANVGFLDSCIDQDFFVYTARFHAANWLSSAEYAMCRDFYEWYRRAFPKPAFIVASAATETRRARVQSRMRQTDLGAEQTRAMLEEHFERFIEMFSDQVALRIDTTRSEIAYEKEIAQILVHTHRK